MTRAAAFVLDVIRAAYETGSPFLVVSTDDVVPSETASYRHQFLEEIGKAVRIACAYAVTYYVSWRHDACTWTQTAALCGPLCTPRALVLSFTL